MSPEQTNTDKAKSSGTEYFSEYCNNTSLHGLKYIGGEKRTILEKSLWIILFAIAVLGCSIMITKTYTKWQNAPVIVSFAENPTPVWSIPFPAVTICPQTKVKRTIFNYTDLFVKSIKKKRVPHQADYFRKMQIICEFMRKRASHEDVPTEDFDDVHIGTDVDYYEGNSMEGEPLITFLILEKKQFLEKDFTLSWTGWTKIPEINICCIVFYLPLYFYVAPTLKEVFKKCIFNSIQYPCSEIFTRTLNEDGVCYTFNILSNEDLFNHKVHTNELTNTINLTATWSIEGGYQNVKGNRTLYPRRVLGSGLKSGLEVELRHDGKDFDYLCQSQIRGFKINLHQPTDIPKVKSQYIRAPIDEEITVAIQPNMLTTSQSLRSYTPEKRNCYFQSERSLKFFKVYTQSNCELECLTEYILKNCGCVVFYMPRSIGTPLCGPRKHRCVKDFEAKFLLEGLGTHQEYTPPCNCYQSCYSLHYSSETSQAPFEWREFKKAIDLIEDAEKSTRKPRNYTDYSTRHYTRLKIFFKDTQFISTQRNELYGYPDFLANCGGIFGLFTGFSILSLMEIIYYLTIRSWVNKHLFGKFFTKTP